MAKKSKIYDAVIEVLEDELPEYTGDLLEHIAHEVADRVSEEVDLDDGLEDVEDELDELVYEDDLEKVEDSDEE